MALLIELTISGKLDDNYLGEQYAIFPRAQMLATLPLHDLFSSIP